MDKSKPPPGDIVLDEEGKKRFLDLARKALNTPVSEEQKQREREYAAKHFPANKPRRST